MGEMKYPLALVVRAVDKATAPFTAMADKMTKATRPLNVGMERLGSRISVIGKRFSTMGKAVGLPKVAENIRGMGEAAGNFSGALGTLVGQLTAIGLASGLAFYGFVRGAEAAGSRLEDLSTKTGFAVNAFAELEYAAKRGGVENEQFAAGMGKFNKSLSEARRKAGPLYALLSKVAPLYAQQLKGVSSNEEAFNLVAKAMAKLPDSGRRAELAAAAFGEAGAGMALALKDGPDAVNALREEYRRLVGDQSAFAAGAGALGDSFDMLELALLGARNALAGALFPAVTKLSAAVTAFAVKNREGLRQWAERTGTAIQAWVDGGGLDRLSESLRSLASTVSGAVDKLGGLENAAKMAAVVLGAPLIGASVQLGVSVGQLAVSLGGLVARLWAVVAASKAGTVALGGLKAAALTAVVGPLKTAGAATVAFSSKLTTTLVGACTTAVAAIRAFSFTSLIAGLTSAATAVWGFTVALLANPITWIVAGIALLAGAVYLIYRNWGPISEWFSELWVGIKLVAAVAWIQFKSWLATNVAPIVAQLMGYWEPLEAFFVGLWDTIVAAFDSAMSKIAPVLEVLKALNPMRLFEDSASGPNLLAPRGAPLLPPGPAPLATQTGSEAFVQVDFNNLPAGTRVQPARGNTAPLALNLGYSMGPL
ncbi:phage tail tape measure protein TP901, core region [Myxococcus stipitatus DSM 14675]|uniref:Phage tail tape measure protein TP901, core region n=1 Tax=Myxococcus stipitatus (strain DSM 14675 / JCM 12634 / Mx s8) TaxID=1278073 RepID=L7U9W1_MYXSD|nr:phage tail tape measure protein TP901, core region [Myxococcus stipitatus]AGC43254.1 phage tail tape measure protein TP901, core region [Myxococcus stipitatus DSM 14675]